MSSIDNFLTDVIGNIVGNTLTDRQKMELLETSVRMLLEVHTRLDRIENRLKDIDNAVSSIEHNLKFNR